MNKSW